MAMLNGLDNSSMWGTFWRGITPESEIQMWDFYGGRPWVLKHTPRYGKVIEAGCGLGRYVFYLSLLGINIEGLDFHEPAVRAVYEWASKRGFQCAFIVGDIRHLPYETESLSGYLSFGVIEHLREGPDVALAEAYRVLRPGGVAIISTPSPSFAQIYFRLRHRAKKIIKKIIGRQILQRPFLQYWYMPAKLLSFVQKSGLKVVLHGACDLKYVFYELGLRHKLWFRIADFLEKTSLRRCGAQSFTVAVKVADEMYCFLCGRRKVRLDRWQRHYMPICDACSISSLAKYYQRRNVPQFHRKWQYNPPLLTLSVSTRLCHFCKQPIRPDALFEDFGFCLPICSECLQVPARNLQASNEFLQPRWRPR